SCIDYCMPEAQSTYIDTTKPQVSPSSPTTASPLCQESWGPDHAGHPPARLHLRPRPPAGRRRLPDAGEPGRIVPGLLVGAEAVAYLDVDDTIRATYGYAKQGTGYGYSGIKGLNVQVATLSTPAAAPVLAATRLRKGNAASHHGAPRLIADAVATARRAGATGTLTV